MRSISLKEQLNQGNLIQAPGVFNALSALLVESAGFPAVYMSGAGLAYAELGKPDLGLVFPGEVLDQVERIADRVHIPVIVDGDTGFGGVFNVQRLVRALERRGASAVQIEDQTFPKRCGHLEGKEVIPVTEMLARIHAAVDTRHSDDFLIIARTDAIAVEGVPSAIERMAAYAEAGADVLFADAPPDISTLQVIARQMRGHPLMANMVEGGKTPWVGPMQLFEMGYRLVIYPNSITRRLVPAIQEVLVALRSTGSTESLVTDMVSFTELNRLLGRDAMIDQEEHWRRQSLTTAENQKEDH